MKNLLSPTHGSLFRLRAKRNNLFACGGRRKPDTRLESDNLQTAKPQLNELPQNNRGRLTPVADLDSTNTENTIALVSWQQISVSLVN
ncbi:MAG: hypothetical protein ACJAVI_000192 [Candidatus Azotimanducaceae bacterium]|jgi:hypothetical protein